MFHFNFYEIVFLNAADTAFMEAKKKKSEQMHMVQHQLKYTKMGFSHSQLNPVNKRFRLERFPE